MLVLSPMYDGADWARWSLSSAVLGELLLPCMHVLATAFQY